MSSPSQTSALLTATVAWNLGGFAIGFFQRAWADTPIPVLPISYSLNAAIVVALPFTREDRRQAAVASSALGGLMALWSAAGALNTPRAVRLGPLPGVFGAGVPMVLGALACVSGYRWARRIGGAKAAALRQQVEPSMPRGAGARETPSRGR